MHVHIRALEEVFLGRHDLSPPWLLLLCHTVPCTHYNDPDFESCVCVCATDTLEVSMLYMCVLIAEDPVTSIEANLS